MFEENKFLYLKWLTLLMLGLVTFFSCQTSSSYNNCPNEEIGTNADSLERLLLGYEPLKVLSISDSLLQKYAPIKNCNELIRIKSARANAYELIYKFEEAVEIYNELIKTVVENQFFREEAAVRLSLARVYETISRPELSIQNLDIAKEIINQHKFRDLLSRYCVRYASYLRIYEKDNILAKKYAARAVQIGKEEGVARSVADGNLLLGMVTENFEESTQYIQRASEQFFKLGDNIGGMTQKTNIAKRYLEREDYDRVLDIVDSVEVYINSITDNNKVYYNRKLRIASLKAEVFEKTGEKDSLITYLKSYNEYSELLGSLVNHEEINQLIIDNSVKQEKAKNETTLRQNKLLVIGLIILTGILLLLSRLYWLNHKGKNKIEQQTETITTQFKELEKLYNYKTTLLSEVHHRIKNNLQLIISLLTLQKAKLGEDLGGGILDMLSYRVNGISLIHEQLYNLKEFDTVDVNLYIDNLLQNFKTLSKEDTVSYEKKIDNIKLNLETIVPLGLIWSELITNSMKSNNHMEELKINLTLAKEGEHYKMHYFDNGKGYPKGLFCPSKVGLGYTIIHSLARQLSAEANAYNANGAHFTLIFKEKTISSL